MAPRPQQSTAGPCADPRETSGATWSPLTRSLVPTLATQPKSASFAWWSRVTTTPSARRPRWTTPKACMWATASMMPLKSCVATADGRLLPLHEYWLANWLRRQPTASYVSMAMYGSPAGDSPLAKRDRMLGCPPILLSAATSTPISAPPLLESPRATFTATLFPPKVPRQTSTPERPAAKSNGFQDGISLSGSSTSSGDI
mmetsp:Transcript_86600/g.268096  ORF Transcript_86600/g.268096 Transcript_86600/m.268096 type:complete len:201 (-) Transcript_86600:74-676(-)